MIWAIRRLRGFAGSLAGRIALILAVGMSCSVIGALFVAHQARRADYERLRSVQVVTSSIDVMTRLSHDPADTLNRLRNSGLVGARLLDAGVQVPATENATLSAMAKAQAPSGMLPTILDVSETTCMSLDPFWRRPRAAGFTIPLIADCWLLTVDSPSGRLRINIDQPRIARPTSAISQPLFLLLIVAASTVLSVIVASLATAPIRRLVEASRAFTLSIDAEPVVESGPADVRQALATFNAMQVRVREGIGERTRLLAAITHDLQTPLTRLRLRLEQVEDAALRERLVKDLSATLGMIRSGLDLARRSETSEDWAVIDLDSMLISMVEDAAEFGHDVRFAGGSGSRVSVKPDALSRCLGNLIDNAVSYAGHAVLSCRQDQNDIVVTVSDNGPGIPDALLGRVFEPFVRGDQQGQTLGTGIGLTIARAQARASGGQLTLRNRPEGGLIAELRLPRRTVGV